MQDFYHQQYVRFEDFENFRRKLFVEFELFGAGTGKATYPPTP